MLVIRDATLSDETDVFTLLDLYKNDYLQTGETLTEDWVKTLIQTEPVWVITGPKKEHLIGIVWWENLIIGYTATIHLLIYPQYIKHFLRQNLGEEILQRARQQWQLKSIQAIFEAKRTRPVRWLQRHAFKPDPVEWDEWMEEGNNWIRYKRMIKFF